MIAGSNLIRAARLRQITPAVGIHRFKPQPSGPCKRLSGKGARNTHIPITGIPYTVIAGKSL